MCLVAIACAQSARFPWVLASNRDEFFGRASAPLAWWRPAPGAAPVLGGRDLSAGGTWLALNETGRLALVTNVREPGRFEPGLPSRGELVLLGLGATPAALAAAQALPRNGYNLLIADVGAGSATWSSNRAPQPRTLGPGLYGLSNAALDTPWPKTRRLKAALRDALATSTSAAALNAALFAALADAGPAPDAELPHTGVPLARERQLSSAFIRIDDGAAVYGTRCSTIVIAERIGARLQVQVSERSYASTGELVHEAVERFEPRPDAE